MRDTRLQLSKQLVDNCCTLQALLPVGETVAMLLMLSTAVNFTTQPGVTFSGYDVPDQADPCSAGVTSVEQCAALCGAMPG
jgi:hypothetical protein